MSRVETDTYINDRYAAMEDRLAVCVAMLWADYNMECNLILRQCLSDDRKYTAGRAQEAKPPTYIRREGGLLQHLYLFCRES